MNMQCFWKSVKKDSKETADAILTLLLILAIGTLAIIVAWAFGTAMLAFLSSIEWTAVTVFRVICIIIVVVHAILVLVLFNKEDMKDADDRVIGKSLTYQAIFIVMVAIFTTLYYSTDWSNAHPMLTFPGMVIPPAFPPVWIETVVTIAWILITTPLYFAYRRCKE